MEIGWNIIETYFKDNPDFLVNHHLTSYNDFFNKEIFNIFKEKNPIKIFKQPIDDSNKDFRLKCDIYFAGKEGNKIYYGKPIVYDENNSHFMFPNEARLRNMTYGFSIHIDIDIDFEILNDEGVIEKQSITIDNIFLGRFPIMLNSDLCILKTLATDVKFNMGECKNDRGGYFIIDGKEKSIICQEKFADNMLYIRDNYNELYSHSAEIRSVSEDASKPVRTSAIRIVEASAEFTNKQFVVVIPNVRKPIPLFILMRALGVISDKKIIEFCLLDIQANDSLLELFVPSIHDANTIFTREVALKYIATFTKGKTVPHVLEILSDYFLPHVGEDNFIDKAYFVGYMTYRLIKVFTNQEKSTDRDSFKFKRVELTGKLIADLFKEYYTLQQRHVSLKIDKEYYYHEGIYQKNFPNLILNNYQEYFKDRILENGFKKAFKGNWGATEHTKKIGLVQDLNRLSFNSFMSQLRKVNLPLDSSAKVVGPRLLHGSQWGIIDPVDTPDGGNVGLHKHMAIGAIVTDGYSKYQLIPILRKLKMKFLQESYPKEMYYLTKIIINGDWCGLTEQPTEIVSILKLYKKIAIIPIYTSISWNIKEKIIYIYTDSGRLTRPVFYIENNKPSYDDPAIYEKLKDESIKWVDIVSGFYPKKVEYSTQSNTVYTLNTLYNTGSSDKETISKLNSNKAIVEYIDTSEAESAYITSDVNNLQKLHTHIEIHPSMILGIMGNQVIFPENNQLPRDLFSCGQSKQAVSLYHSNYQNRIDKMGVVLNYGQIPLVKSKYLKYINNEQHPNGVNAIVAIMCYTGYNTEDAVLFNEASLKRGIFNTTYYNSYEAREESTKVLTSNIDVKFSNIESLPNVFNLKPGYDYSHLDEYGLIKENTKLDDKSVVIGMALTDMMDPNKSIDASIMPKKGQLGYVDKTFMTEGEEGFRIAKVRIREERIPAIGDKFCSRCGQKGTIGLIIPEKDMPFTAEGLRPDMIINPHALPSRMTIGQLVETLMGKSHLHLGAFGSCTAFDNKGTKSEIYGDVLTNYGYHSSGNELLYNGLTGEQIQSEIFIGPTYYMRLKHMVKDKINYRAKGPRSNLTRQTVGGRANDGGLRIGEMERDGVLAHGMSKFLNESLMVRGDEYHIAVCNKSGLLAIYNKEKNIFISPAVDGPLNFTINNEGNHNIEHISNHGKSFSILRVPYSFKLLIQELASMNIQLRIITDDNIEQISNMSYSNNINKLLQTSETNITNTIRKLVRSNRDKEFKFKLKSDITVIGEPISAAPPAPAPAQTAPAQTAPAQTAPATTPTAPTETIPKPATTPTEPTAKLQISDLAINQKVKLVNDINDDTWNILGIDDDDIVIKSSTTSEIKISNLEEIKSVEGVIPASVPSSTDEPSPPFVPSSTDEPSPPFVPSSTDEPSPPFVPSDEGLNLLITKENDDKPQEKDESSKTDPSNVEKKSINIL